MNSYISGITGNVKLTGCNVMYVVESYCKYGPAAMCNRCDTERMQQIGVQPLFPLFLKPV